MLTKLYETIIKYIKKEYKFLITLLIILILTTIKLPYYIDMPGGIINISDRIKIDDKTFTGTLNFSYVSETQATIPMYIISKINKNWDIIKKEEIILENETEQEVKFRDELSLKEAVSNALYAGMKEAQEDFKVTNNKIYITYIYEQAQTDLKIGDQILEINNKKIENKEDLKDVTNYEIGTNIKIKVLNNNKEYIRNAKIIELDNRKIIGVAIEELFDIESNHNIDINYHKRESGPSGGMMLALATYNYLTDSDLTKGKKIVGTGTIDTYGNVGEIGGVKYKLIGAVKNKADIFLVPKENYEEAIKIKEEKKYDIKIVSVSTLKEAIDALKNYN